MIAENRNKTNEQIDRLLAEGQWAAAGALLEKQREADPENHWVLTQLGVTLYEQRQYDDALKLFQASLKVVPDCPLTLWNLAGTFDAIGNTANAMTVYTWLLQSKKSSRKDPCWESEDWADALKADCVFRLGVCFQHRGKKKEAEHCYRQYLDLLSLGVMGTYPIDVVANQKALLRNGGKSRGATRELSRVVKATLKASGIKTPKTRKNILALFPSDTLSSGRRVARKS